MDIASTPHYYAATLTECQAYAAERMREIYDKIGSYEKAGEMLGVSLTTVRRACEGILPHDVSIIRKVIMAEL